MLGAALDARAQGRIDEWVVKETELELDAENGTDGAVQVFFSKGAVFSAGYDRVLKGGVVEVVELHVYACCDRVDDGLLRSGGGVVVLQNAADGAQVGEDEAAKAPFAAENVFKEVGVFGCGHAV